MNKYGFEILKTRRESNDVSKILYDKLGFILPMYYLFVDMFELGEECITYEKYKIDGKRYYYMQSLIYSLPELNIDNITFTHFDTVSEVIKNYNNYYGYTDLEVQLKLLKIGGIALGGGLFVGTEKDNLDVIYLKIWDETPEPIKIADNIFQFIKNLKLLDDDSPLPNKVKYSEISKKWYQDYWEKLE